MDSPKSWVTAPSFSRTTVVERTKAGLAASRARGRNGGRPKTDPRKIEKAIKLYEARTHSLAEIQELTGVSKPTLYRALKKRKTTQFTHNKHVTVTHL